MTTTSETDRRPTLRWPEGYFTARDGVRIHYVTAGAGAPVILLHGAGGSAIGNWFSNGIAPALCASNQVIAFDLRGHGLSEGRAHDLDAMAEDAIAFMDRCGFARAHFAGYSMGASVMVRIMARCPERFITACFQGAGISETSAWGSTVAADTDGSDPDEPRAMALARARRAARGQEIGNDLRDKVERIVISIAGRRAVHALEDLVGRFLARRSGLDLSRIAFPVMAINGQFDRPRARTHRLWRELPDFTNVILPGKGHLTAMMAGFIPNAYIEAYAAFVASHNPKGAR